MKGRKGLAFFLIAVLLLAAVPEFAAAEEVRVNPSVITGYSSSLTSIQKGDLVTITVSVKDTDFWNWYAQNNLDVTKLADSFSGGTVSVNITSKNGEPLTYDITFSNMVYSGSGQSLRFMVGYRRSEMPYETHEVSIREAVEYTETEPVVLISREEIDEPLEAGEEMDVTVTFQNLSKTVLSSPVATFSPSESLTIVGDSFSVRLASIPAQGSQSVTVRIKAQGTISASVQSLNVELKYYYNNKQGQAAEKISIPAKIKRGETQPTLIVTRSSLKPIEAKQSFELSVYIKNASEVDIENVVVNVTADTLLLKNKRSTFVIKRIKAGDKDEIVLKLKAPKEITSPTQNISLEIKYAYDSGESMAQATVSERLSLSSILTEAADTDIEMDSAVPNVIIRSFDYGSESIAAGSSFPLNIVFVNTGKIAIENIVATVDGGESFTIAGGTNTFYYDRLGAGGEATQLIQMQALPTAETGAQAMNISFKYEYVDGKKRSSGSADIKLSIPVLQPERFQVDTPNPPEYVFAWEETVISINYVNKGKSDINNVEATIEGNVQALTPSQFLGNFAPGKSGTINFIFTPMEPGETEVLLKISYENANQEVKTLEFPVKLTVNEAYIPEEPMDFPMEEPQEKKSVTWILIPLGNLLLIVLIIVIRIVRKKRAKKKQAEEWSEWDASWEDDQFNKPEDAEAGK